MMQEFYNELQSGKGPVFLKLDHLHEDTVKEIAGTLHNVERPTRGRFHENRSIDYNNEMIEMHISEIGFCSGHSASGVWVDEHARTTVPGLYAAGDMASVPHNYMLGAFTNGMFAGEDAVDYIAEHDFAEIDKGQVEAEMTRVLAPTKREDGIPPNQIEYKTRRLVNDYLQPPKVTRKMLLAQDRFAEVREDLNQMAVTDSHELMRSLEAQSILDCADMAAHASMFRTESRWGLYHAYADHPEKDNDDWFCHAQLKKDENGKMTSSKRPVDPYIVDIDEDEMGAYDRQRV